MGTIISGVLLIPIQKYMAPPYVQLVWSPASRPQALKLNQGSMLNLIPVYLCSGCIATARLEVTSTVAVLVHCSLHHIAGFAALPPIWPFTSGGHGCNAELQQSYRAF
jgi:hypothetical protein